MSIRSRQRQTERRGDKKPIIENDESSLKHHPLFDVLPQLGKHLKQHIQIPPVPINLQPPEGVTFVMTGPKMVNMLKEEMKRGGGTLIIDPSDIFNGTESGYHYELGLAMLIQENVKRFMIAMYPENKGHRFAIIDKEQAAGLLKEIDADLL